MNQTENGSEITLEEGFVLLDEITKKMDTADITLEERFDLYQQGMALIRTCTEKIDLVEKKLMLVNEDGTVTEQQ